MEFLAFLNQLIIFAQGLASVWPVLLIHVGLVPAAVNLLKVVAAKFGWSFDGYSNIVSFVLDAGGFLLYGYLVLSGAGYEGIEPVVGALATILTVLAGLIGNLVSGVAYHKFWAKLPGALGYSYSK